MMTPATHEQHVIASGLAAWRLTRSFTTDIAKSPISGAETRHGRAGAPILSVPVAQMADRLRNGAAGYGLLVSNAMSAGRVAPPQVEVWPDMAYLRSPASGTFIPCDPSLRRFVVGAWCRVIDWGNRPGVGRVEDAQIIGLREDGIEVALPLAEVYPVGAIVLPLVQVDPATSARGQSWGCGTGNVSYRSSTRILEQSPPAIVRPGTVPPGFPSFAGLPVLVDWLTPQTRRPWGVERDGGLISLGLGLVADFHGPRSRWTTELSLGTRTRTESWGLMGFFDSRGGAAHPFFLPDYAEPLKVARVEEAVPPGNPGGLPESPARLEVAASFEEDRWGSEDVVEEPEGTQPGERRWIAMRLAGGAYAFARIVDVERINYADVPGQPVDQERSDVVDLLTLDPDPGPIGDIEEAWPMRKVRGEDTCEEEWVNLDEMRMKWKIIELLNERPVPTLIACASAVGMTVASDFGSGAGGTTPPGGPGTVYRLDGCNGGTTYTRQDLSAFVGRVLDIGGGFATVSAETDTGQGDTTVIYGADYTDCDATPPSVPGCEGDQVCGFSKGQIGIFVTPSSPPQAGYEFETSCAWECGSFVEVGDTEYRFKIVVNPRQNADGSISWRWGVGGTGRQEYERGENLESNCSGFNRTDFARHEHVNFEV